jgi:phage-related protein
MDAGWKVVFCSARVEREILALPEALVARFLRYAERLEAFGPDLGMPHTKPMGRGLFELRLKAKEGIGRVLYCTVPGRRIVMLHQFVKKTQKTPAREIEIARWRMKELSDV